MDHHANVEQPFQHWHEEKSQRRRTEQSRLLTHHCWNQDNEPGAHMLKPLNVTTVSLNKALSIHANAQAASFGIAQHWNHETN